MTPLHVGIICEEYPPEPHGGTGASYRDLAEGLVEQGHRVTIIGVRSSPELAGMDGREQRGVRVFRLPPAPKWWHYRLKSWWEHRALNRCLGRLHRDAPFDALEASDFHGWLSGASPRRVPSIVRIRGSNLFFDAELDRKPSVFEHRLERASLAAATHLAAVSRYAAHRTLELAGLAERECTVIHNAVDTAVFSPGEAADVEPGLVLYVNSLNPKKGIGELIEAANLVFPSRPNSRLVVIGRDTQHRLGGGYLQQLREKVREDLRDRVLFTGRLEKPEIVSWLRRAAVCCYPSHMETFGIAPLEAMSVGRPVIFTRSGPGPEIIEHGATGLLCDPKDPASIAESLARLLDGPGEAEAMGKRARARVLEAFEKSAWVRWNAEYYRKCAEAMRTAPVRGR